MGYILRLKCCKCDNEKLFNLGNGRRDFDINTVAKNFEDKSIIEEILNLDGGWLFNWKLAQCKKCKEVFRVPMIMLLDEQGQQLVENKCNCGCADVELVNDENEPQIKCDKCGEKYDVENIGLWD